MSSPTNVSRCVEPSCQRSDPIGNYHQCIKCNGHLHSWCGSSPTNNLASAPRLCSPCVLPDYSEPHQRTPTPTLPVTVVADAPSSSTKRQLLQDRLDRFSKIRSIKKGTEKNSRTRLDVQTKLLIAEQLQEGVAQTVVMKRYNVSRRLCSKIKSDAPKLRKLMEEHSGIENRKSFKPGHFMQLETCLLKFFSLARKAGLSVTRDVLHVRAMKIREELLGKITGDTEKKALEKFSASEHWISNFVRRHQLKSVTLHGQAGSVDHKKIEEGMKQLRKDLQPFSLDRIYNMDETGLFYRLLPRKSYVYYEERNNVRGVKGMKAKDRITLIITTNADGSHIFPYSVIGSAQNPRAFNLRECPLPYLSQKKAWNDGLTCRKWFIRDFLPAVRKKTSKEVALIIYNASSHGTELIDPIGQVKILFLPPNCTSVHQPMDCGIIASVKIRYRYTLLEKTVELLEERDALRTAAKSLPSGTKGVMEGYPPHVLDALAEIQVL